MRSIRTTITFTDPRREVASIRKQLVRGLPVALADVTVHEVEQQREEVERYLNKVTGYVVRITTETE